MKKTGSLELPDELKKMHSKATTLEWITLVYMSMVIILMYLVMGNSQAMKTAWLEDLLSIVPCISFLLAHYFYEKPASERFPYGLHKVYSNANIAGSVALTSMGLFLFLDSVFTLIKMERATIGTISILGRDFWLGYAMIVVLILSSFPAAILGRKKLPLAKKLHNKILFTDADTQKADWFTGVAAMIGIIGIGFGIWWTDAVAALVISTSVLKDGITDLVDAWKDSLDQTPRQIANKTELDPLVVKLQHYLHTISWVAKVEIRIRDVGQVCFGEIFFVPDNEEDILTKTHNLKKLVEDLDWRFHDIVVMPVKELK